MLKADLGKSSSVAATVRLRSRAALDAGVTLLEDTIGAIADLVNEGKVRYPGTSEMGTARLHRAHAVHPVTELQIEYSLALRLKYAGRAALDRAFGRGAIGGECYPAPQMGLVARRARCRPIRFR